MEEGITLAWDNLSVYVNVKKKGKTDIKRIINSGELLSKYMLNGIFANRYI